MADPYPQEKRSWIMSRVRGRDTKPEIVVRSLVHRMGFRFRVHRRDLPGTPDIVFPRLRKVILVHGCFWHGHRGCKRSKRPTTNAEFWNDKLSRNLIRDRRSRRALRRAGWQVLVIWQCETRRPDKLLKRLQAYLYAETGQRIQLPRP